MKQEIITHLTSIQEEIYNLSKYLYEYPEESFCEHKSYTYLTDVLKKHDFIVQENFLDMPTAFLAQFGEGHPKICYICEYDCSCKDGHILGTNLVSSMSIGAALGLSKIIPKIGGSIIVLGCPGEFLGGSKVTMAKQGVFQDIDIILMAQPSLINANCCSSPAILPVKINHSCNGASCFVKTNGFSALDASLFLLNSINTILKGHSKGCSIDKISINGDSIPHILPENIQTSFLIKAPSLKEAEEIRDKINRIAFSLEELMGIPSKVILSGVPYENFICNKTLYRIFSHNLKEAGIIHINQEEASIPYGLSLGNASHLVPSLRFLINISEDKSLKYACSDFAEVTLSTFAQGRVMDTIKALAITGLDLIKQPDLISEAKLELHNYIKKH